MDENIQLCFARYQALPGNEQKYSIVAFNLGKKLGFFGIDAQVLN